MKVRERDIEKRAPAKLPVEIKIPPKDAPPADQAQITVDLINQLREKWEASDKARESFLLNEGIAVGTDKESVKHNKKYDALETAAALAKLNYETVLKKLIASRPTEAQRGTERKDATNNVTYDSEQLILNLMALQAKRNSELDTIRELSIDSQVSMAHELALLLQSTKTYVKKGTADPTRSEMQRDEQGEHYNRTVETLRRLCADLDLAKTQIKKKGETRLSPSIEPNELDYMIRNQDVMTLIREFNK
jgi:hypothetical protein